VASGAEAGKLADVGIDDTIRKIASQPRVRAAVPARAVGRCRQGDRRGQPFNPTAIQANLTKEPEEELIRRCNCDGR
jgi:hypothetical protein